MSNTKVLGSSRYKKVFSSHSEVCHVWAQQSQPEGRASSIFFEDEKIYSYGYHFLMAQFTETKDSEKIVIVNSNSYSPSTGKHQNYVNRAIYNTNRIFIPFKDNIYINFPHAIAELCKKVDEELLKATRALTNKDWHLRLAHNHAATISKILRLFEVEILPEQQKYIDGSLFESDYESTFKDQIKKEREENKIKNAAILEENKEKVNEWLNGYSNYFPSKVKEVYLRRKDDDVQTSLGAIVTAGEARLLYQALKHNVDIIGRKIGYYTVNSITPKYIVIGCHTITRKEVERFATSQNW